MIRAQSLSKSYGPHLAVNDISFEVAKGEVVGFLGKNGAGKTTTMRMLAGSLAIGSGSARIGGFDVAQNPRKVKAIVGYLPEVPPIYPHMRVDGYLKFCAQLRGVSEVADAVNRVIAQTGLFEVKQRPIGNLSKGYRQRVGIAQALVHSPTVLILDEPVSGLDPGQRREIRELIRSLAEGETTVLLSTHVLSEIEAICNRVLIVDQGALVQDNTMDALSSRYGKLYVQVSRPTEDFVAALRAIDGVVDVQEVDSGAFEVAVERDVREDVGLLAIPCGLVELRTPQVLEELFVQLTEGAS